MRRTAFLLAIILVLGGCATDPSGVRLRLPTEGAGRAGGCDLTALAPVRIEREGDTMVFVDSAGSPVSIIWPFGFAAWLEFDVAVLYASDGSVVGREGAVLDTIGGSADAAGFHVCKVGLRTYS